MFGVSEAFSVLISGYMMSRFKDMTVFNFVFAYGLIAYVIYIFFSDVGNLCYVGIIFLV